MGKIIYGRRWQSRSPMDRLFFKNKFNFMPTVLSIYFANTAQISQDDQEVIDAGLVGAGCPKNKRHLTYLGYDGSYHIYEFGPETTVELIEKELARIKELWPILVLEYHYF